MKKVKLQKIKISVKKTAGDVIKITSSDDLASNLKSIFDADSIDWYESMVVISLNATNEIIGFHKVSSGGMTSSIADPRIIFQFALLSCAVSIVLAHNHPSGNVKPSQSDIDITNQIKKGGQLLNIKLLDHIIISSNNHYSFADNDLI